MKASFDDIDIYPVVNRSLFGGRTDEEVIAALAAGGARIVQLRDKQATGRELFERALLYRRETERLGMLLIVNDRLDVALAAGADGVHLGRSDLPVTAARALAGPSFIIGASSHTVEQARAAEREGASYVNIGPVFATPTKPGVAPVGTAPLAGGVAACAIPVTTMGGIVAANLDEVLATGVRHVGVVTALFGAADIAAATRELVTRIRAARREEAA